MKRRAFLGGLLAAAATPAFAKLPIPEAVKTAVTPPCNNIIPPAQLLAMDEMCREALARIVNPPVIITQSISELGVTSYFLEKYRAEFLQPQEPKQ